MKMLFAELVRDPVSNQRFRNEAVAMIAVDHPHVVRGFGLIEEEGIVAYSMEYVEGGDLAKEMARVTPIPVARALEILGQICDGLAAVHKLGIVHRNITPENILFTRNGVAKIADFGIARTSSGPRLTDHGGVVGTIDYVSPEYLEHGEADHRSDIYALGTIAYEMITQRAPFIGESVVQTMIKRLREQPEPPHVYRQDCPPELSRIVLKALARESEQRYQTAYEMSDDLARLRSAHAFGGA